MLTNRLVQTGMSSLVQDYAAEEENALLQLSPFLHCCHPYDIKRTKK